jgi:hypothetical protein
MVKIFAVLLALTAVAYAEGDEGIDNGPPLLLGFRLATARLPVGGQDIAASSLGLDVDHPIAHGARIFGEYDWMWIDHDPTSMQHGSGHRLLAGLRYAVAEKHDHHFHVFSDVEAGGGMSVLDDSILGVRVLPTGFVGLRAGYGFTATDSPSRVFDVELTLRALIVPDGTGGLVGIGMQWGN